jgi:hypothetical protein
MIKQIYEIMTCADGVTRAVAVVDGEMIDPSIEIAAEKEKEEADAEKKPVAKISIQDRMKNKVEDFISAIEGQVDDFIDSDYKMIYDGYNHMLEVGCKAAHARQMRPFYVDCFNELVDVYNKDDEYYVDAWSHLKPKYHKIMMDFYGTIVDDLDRIIKNSTAQRKPRKKKTLSAAKLVNKLKYQQEFSELKLVSINPEKIIGAKELWVYNTSYNKLGVYHAVNSIRGFSVKGCTIKDYDEQESIQKKARKPKEALNVLTKRTLKAMLKSMKTKEQPLSGRINAQTILLGVF